MDKSAQLADSSTFGIVIACPFGVSVVCFSSMLLTRAVINRRDRQLEKDYVINLQQQVYFLELELNLLKKASVPKAVGGT